MIRLGESCLELDVLEEAVEQEVRADMAGAYERTGEEETAAEWYARLLEQTEEKEERKEYFAKAAALYEQCGKTDLALELCAQGIKEFRRKAPFRSSTSACSARILLWTGGSAHRPFENIWAETTRWQTAKSFRNYRKNTGSKWKEKRYGSENEEHCGFTDGAGAAVLAAGRAGL